MRHQFGLLPEIIAAATATLAAINQCVNRLAPVNARAIAGKVLHALPPANDSIALRETLMLSTMHLFVVQFLLGHTNPKFCAAP